MSLDEFIKKHREEIDKFVFFYLDAADIPYKNDEERRLWILNNENLYNWAKSNGVDI